MSKLVFSLLPMKITYLFDSRFCNLFLCFMFSDQLRYVIKKVQKLKLYYDPINAIKVIPSLLYLVALLSNNQSCFCNVRVDRIDEIVYTHKSDWKNKDWGLWCYEQYFFGTWEPNRNFFTLTQKRPYIFKLETCLRIFYSAYHKIHLIANHYECEIGKSSLDGILLNLDWETFQQVQFNSFAIP